MYVSVSMSTEVSQVSDCLELELQAVEPPEVGTRSRTGSAVSIFTTELPLQAQLHLLSRWHPQDFKQQLDHCAFLTNPKLPPWTLHYQHHGNHTIGTTAKSSTLLALKASCPVRFLVQMSDVSALWDCFLSGSQQSHTDQHCCDEMRQSVKTQSRLLDSTHHRISTVHSSP